MNYIFKLFRHIKNNTILDRIIRHKEYTLDGNWNNFMKSTNSFIIKNHKLYKLKLYKNDQLSKAIYFEKFENTELNFVKKIVKKNSIFIDLGANIGIFSMVAHKKMKNTGKIFSVEASPITFEKLKENISLVKAKNIVPLNIAISDHEGFENFYYSKTGYDAWNSFVKPIENDYISRQIATFTIDSLIKQYNIKIGDISLIKIDIEGWERRAIQGGINTLKSFNAPDLLIEFTEKNAQAAGTSCKDLYIYLKQLGYKLYSFQESDLINVHETDDFSYVNVYATKKHFENTK